MIKKEEMITLVKEAIGTMEPIFGACIHAMKKASELIANFRSLEPDMENLRTRMEELSAKEEDVMNAVEKEVMEQGKKRKREVALWQKNVKRKKNEVNSIEEKVREERLFWRRPTLRENIKDLTIEVERLKEKCVFPDGVAMETLVSAGRPQPTPTLLGESANKTLKMIWDLLLDVEIKTVGVFGMGGVGKTTIMKHIHNELLNSHVFTSNIWVTVSKDLDLRRLQDDIASAIGVRLPNDEIEEIRSSKLCATLSRSGRCLLILDDLWEAFSLDRIGIPEPTQTNGFKLVITSRTLNVCRGMESERTVKVEVLSDNEAWNLFKEKVGGCVLDSEEIEPIAKDIIKECGRLPLALITVGRALREVGDFRVWRNALAELKRSTADIAGLDHVFSGLMFSYNRLRNDMHQACFLYCALYPEDHVINTEELIEKWMGEGLIDEIGDRKEEKDKGYTILLDLKDACMIEDGHWNGCVKLHDLIRDLAIIITRKKPRFMVKAGLKLKKSPRIEEWTEDTMRVSLMNNKIEVLSGQPMCPALCTLLLQGNLCLREISNSFFECIRGLKVLDLSSTSIESLPEQISELEELRVLQLSSCRHLNRLPSVAKLKQLRILGLVVTAIEELPRGMEELVNLRFLDLGNTYKLQMLPAGLLSKLSLLEDFRMFGSGWRWASKSIEEGTANADVEEIGRLTRLANITLSLEDVQGFNKFARISENLQLLESFSFHLGKRPNAIVPILHLGKNGVWVCGVRDASSHLSSLMLPYNTKKFQIDYCDGISRLSQLRCLANANQINHCKISNCTGMEFIVMADEKISSNFETLDLRGLPNLRALSYGNSPIQTFANLKSLAVSSCKKMKSLLTIGLLQCLFNLETIHVAYCQSMEDIVADDGNDIISNFSFSKLKDLYLWALGKLKSIWNRGFSCPSLVSITILGCKQLKKLPFTSYNVPPNLEKLEGEKEWWDALEWEDSIAKTNLQSCFVAWA